jgi:hypothetical protein
MSSSPSTALLQRRGEDDGYPNYLRAPKPVPMVITTCLAYSSTIFICLDGFHPSLHYPSIVKLNGQKFGLHQPLEELENAFLCGSSK